MTLLHDAYTALLSGLTTKTGNEIHWQNEDGEDVTIEIIDVEQKKYTVRYYYSNGKKEEESNYQNGELHGRYIYWGESGQKELEEYYQNDELIRKVI